MSNIGNTKPKVYSSNRSVFVASSISIFAIIFAAAFASEAARGLIKNLQHNLVENFGWVYVFSVAVIFVSVIFFAASRYGDIKLGPNHAQPSFNYISWFAMLFSAGMGIGIMFFGVAEPVKHFLSPPIGDSATIHAAKESMKITFFHWGLHAWSIYAAVGLILAYYSFRKNLPLTLRSAFYPLIGKKIWGWTGHIVDICAIIGTILGIATSLGYGSMQINSGLAHLFGIAENLSVQSLIILVATSLTACSLVLGLDRGIKRLSEINLLLGVLLLLVTLFFGQTSFLFKSFFQNSGEYLAEIVSKTFNLYAYEPNEWIGGWTLFYWGWWLSWSPFVGIFIARISRGRTIREFVTGVMLVPTMFNLLWMSVFGNSAIYLIMHEGQNSLASAVEENTAKAFFEFLNFLPFSHVISVAAIVMILVFFVTSADSGAFVVNMIAANGNDKTSMRQKLYWTSIIGGVSLILLKMGGLDALQTATIVGAFPFSILLLFAIFGLRQSLKQELLKTMSLRDPMNTTTRETDSDSWRLRVHNLVNVPETRDVYRFVSKSVKKSLMEVARELRKNGLDTVVNKEDDRVYLKVKHGQEMDFLYEVRIRNYQPPSFAMSSSEKVFGEEKKNYVRSEVFLKEGGQGYDIMGYTDDQIIADVIDQYEKHLHFLSLIR